MTPDGNFNLHRGIKSTRNGAYVSIYKSYFPHFKTSLKDNCLFKAKVVIMYFVVYKQKKMYGSNGTKDGRGGTEVYPFAFWKAIW